MAQRVASGDSNLWCREYESGVSDDPENHAMEQDLYQWTADTGSYPEEQIAIGFENGLPVTVDGRTMDLGAVITSSIIAWGNSARTL
ncbi:hypothetical protein ACFRAU_15015 [Arthrobacter sp. NPDC056691]|uniref:hypothetical protein n=1 Tax=Arthrobacter sp. NPDC056691 TaxID=3345913 RepID=UPI0036710F4E